MSETKEAVQKKKVNWETKRIKISELKNWEKNPRTISKDKFKDLGSSLDKLGDFGVLVVDHDKNVISGNQRLRAMLEQGIEEVDVKIPSRELTQKEIDEIGIRSNVSSGIWDIDILANQFDEDLVALTDIEVPTLDIPVEEDSFEEPEMDSVKTDIQKGDLFQLGSHRLMCGDSTMIDDVGRLMDGKKADMVFTDPPYGVSYQSNMRTKTQRFNVIHNDNKYVTDWLGYLNDVSHGFIFIWTTWKVLSIWIHESSIIGDMSNMIIWDKGGGGIGDLEKTFSTDYEIALVWNRGHKLTGKRIGSVWSIGKDFAGNYKHPTQKPVELAATAISTTTNTNSIVLDLFGGSGSTLIACEQLNRKCYMMELEPKYCQVIIDRWEKLTNNKAKKL